MRGCEGKCVQSLKNPGFDDRPHLEKTEALQAISET